MIRSLTMVMSIKKVKDKELERENPRLAIKIMQNGYLIIDMDAERWNSQMEVVIGGNSRMVKCKDMVDG